MGKRGRPPLSLVVTAPSMLKRLMLLISLAVSTSLVTALLSLLYLMQQLLPSHILTAQYRRSCVCQCRLLARLSERLC
jgi:hypothetical protein